jgi:F-type H+-transporting ATPase subunit alpha
LLERSAQLSKRLNYGSLTALPLIETQANNLASYIPTNVISITDGQIFLTRDLSNRKVYPAMDITRSVSRIGSKAQPFLLTLISSKFKTMLQNFFKYSEFIRFNYTLSLYDQILFNKAICASKLSIQREPRFFEESIILIIAAENGLLCPKYTHSSIKLILNKLYTRRYR